MQDCVSDLIKSAVESISLSESSTMAAAGYGEERNVELCSNAIWCVGQIATTCTAANSEILSVCFAPFLQEAIQRIGFLLAQQKLEKSLALNLAAALGKISNLAPERLATD